MENKENNKVIAQSKASGSEHVVKLYSLEPDIEAVKQKYYNWFAKQGCMAFHVTGVVVYPEPAGTEVPFDFTFDGARFALDLTVDEDYKEFVHEIEAEAEYLIENFGPGDKSLVFSAVIAHQIGLC